MKLIFKRFTAYLIDIIFVAAIISFIQYSPDLNINYNEYNKTYDSYEEYYNGYVSDKEELDSKLNSNDMTKQEYDKEVKELEDNYVSKSQHYNYILDRQSIEITFLSVLAILLYFCVIQFYMGQTIGKKIMKIKVVSNNGKDLTLFNFFTRSLIVNEAIISICNLIFVIVLQENSYIIYNQVIFYITYVLELLIMFTILFNKNNRGIHDIVANTKVVDVSKKVVV